MDLRFDVTIEHYNDEGSRLSSFVGLHADSAWDALKQGLAHCVDDMNEYSVVRRMSVERWDQQ